MRKDCMEMMQSRHIFEGNQKDLGAKEKGKNAMEEEIQTPFKLQFF